MTAPATAQDPLAGYTPDWRQRLQPSAADPLAGYTQDWRRRLEPTLPPIVVHPEPTLGPIVVTPPAHPVEFSKLPADQRAEHERRLGLVHQQGSIAHGVARGLGHLALGIPQFFAKAAQTALGGAATPEELRNVYIRARLRTMGINPDAMLHEAIRGRAEGTVTDPVTQATEFTKGALTMGYDLQRSAQGGPLWQVDSTGHPSLVTDNPELSSEEQADRLTQLVGNAFLLAAGAKEERNAAVRNLEPVPAEDLVARATAAVRGERPGPVQGPRPAPPPVPEGAQAPTAAPEPPAQPVAGPSPSIDAGVTPGVTPDMRALENEAATLSALRTRTPEQQARLRELGAQLGRQPQEPPPPVEQSGVAPGVIERQAAEATDRIFQRERRQQQVPVDVERRQPAPVPAVGRLTADDVINRHRAIAEGPGTIYRVPTSVIRADPERFQFKETGAEGVTPELRNVQKFSPQAAGVLSVWRDPADGQVYVVNGHHRLELAKRLGVPDLYVQFLDAPNARAARAEGAFLNMQEGRGTATDVAKFLRDYNATPADLEARGVSLRGDVTREGLALSRLAPDVFDQVATGKVPQGWGVAIGSLLDDAALQREAVKAAQGSGRRLSAPEVTEIARQVRDAGAETVNQETLFGTEEERHGLYADRAQLATALKKRLASDRRLFGYVSREGRAAELSRAGGTQIDVEAARGIAEQSARAEEVFDRLYTRSGPIAEVVREGAKRIAQGERPAAVATELYPAVSDAVSRELTTAGERPGPSGAQREVPAGTGAPAAEGEQAAAAPGAPEDERVRNSTDEAQSGLFSPERPALRLTAEGPEQASLLGERAGTTASRSLSETERDAAAQLPSLRERLRLSKDPRQRVVLGERISTIEKLLNRGRAITAPELAAEAAARGEPGVRTGPDQAELFSPVRPGSPFAARLRRLLGRTPEENADAKALADISRDLADAVGVPLRQGRFNAARRRAVGVFKPFQEVTRTVRFDKLDTAAHEVGHYISKKWLRNPTKRTHPPGVIPLKLPKEAARELVQMGRDLYGGRKPAGGYGEEGIAEYFSFYVTEPATLKTKAPVFDGWMRDVLQHEPALRKALDQARDDFARYQASPPNARLAGMLSVNERNRFQPSIRWLMKTWLDDVYEFKSAIEDMGASPEPSHDAYVLARLTRGSSGAAEEMLQRGVVQYGTIKRAGPSVEAALAGVGAPRIQAFREYLVAESALDRWKRGIDSGISAEDAAAVAEAGRKEFGEAAQAVWDHYRALIEYRRDAGMLTLEQAKKIVDANPHHVSFYREFTPEEQGTGGGRGTGRGYTRTSGGVKRQTGSSRRIVDPLESVFTDTYQTVSQVKKYEVARDLVRAARATEGAGRVIEEVPAPQRPVTIPIERLRDQLADLGFAPPGGQSVEEWISQPEMQALLTSFQDARVPGAAEGKDLVVPLLAGDQIRWYAVRDRALFDAMQGLGTPEVNGLMRWLSAPVRLLRAGATLTFEFAFGRNPVRDMWTSSVYSRAKTRPPGFRLAEGLFHMLKADEAYQTYRLEGGENAAMLGLDRVHSQQTLGRLLRTRSIGGKALEVVRHPLDTLRLVSSIMENATRIGESAAVQRELLRSGVSPNDARKLGTLAGRDVSVDFAQGGTAAKAINNIVWTFNASLRGTAQLLRETRLRPGVVIPRALAFITLPSIVLYLAQKDDPEYQETPAWLRNTAWVWIQRGSDRGAGWDGYGSGKVEHRWAFPKPFEPGVLFGTVPERIVEWLYTHKPAVLEHLWEAIKQQFAPPATPTAVAPIIENFANRSLYRDRPIVPRGREDFPAAEQTAPHTSETAQLLGRALHYSPAKIDNLVRGYTGGLGQYATGAADAALRRAMRVGPPEEGADDPLAHIPLIRAFVRRAVTTDAESVEEFYRAFDEADGYRRAWRARLAAGRQQEANAYLAAHKQQILSVATVEEAGAPGPLRVVHDQLDRLQQLRRNLSARDLPTRANAAAEQIRRRTYATTHGAPR